MQDLIFPSSVQVPRLADSRFVPVRTLLKLANRFTPAFPTPVCPFLAMQRNQAWAGIVKFGSDLPIFRISLISLNPGR